MVKGSDDYRQSDDLNRRYDPLASRRFGDGHEDSDHDMDKNSDDIRAEICRTRAEMDETVNALQQRLDPQQLVHRVFDVIRDNAGDVTNKIIGVVRDNPVPAALVGLGLAWLAVKQIKGPPPRVHRPKAAVPPGGGSFEDLEYGFFEQYQEIDEFEETGSYAAAASSGGSEGGYPTGSPVPSKPWKKKNKVRAKVERASKEAAGKIQEHGNQAKSSISHAAEKIQNIGSQAMSRVHDVTDYVKDKAADLKDKASNLGEQVQSSARQAKDWAGQTMDEYPLAVGAAFFTLGLAGGLAIPATKPENQILGPTRDRLFNQAQEVGSELIDKGQQAAKRAVGAVKEAVARGPNRPDFDET